MAACQGGRPSAMKSAACVARRDVCSPPLLFTCENAFCRRRNAWIDLSRYIETASSERSTGRDSGQLAVRMLVGYT